jgi:hypothetical protein
MEMKVPASRREFSDCLCKVGTDQYVGIHGFYNRREFLEYYCFVTPEDLFMVATLDSDMCDRTP